MIGFATICIRVEPGFGNLRMKIFVLNPMPICNHPMFLLRAFAIMPFEPNLECKSHHSQSLMCAKDRTKTGPAVKGVAEQEPVTRR